MEFKSAKELLTLCKEHDMPISAVMRTRECTLGETDEAGVDARMARAWDIMRTSAHEPLTTPLRSMGGLIGGGRRDRGSQARQQRDRAEQQTDDPFFHRVPPIFYTFIHWRFIPPRPSGPGGTPRQSPA